MLLGFPAYWGNRFVENFAVFNRRHRFCVLSQNSFSREEAKYQRKFRNFSWKFSFAGNPNCPATGKPSFHLMYCVCRIPFYSKLRSRMIKLVKIGKFSVNNFEQIWIIFSSNFVLDWNIYNITLYPWECSIVFSASCCFIFYCKCNFSFSNSLLAILLSMYL